MLLNFAIAAIFTFGATMYPGNYPDITATSADQSSITESFRTAELSAPINVASLPAPAPTTKPSTGTLGVFGSVAISAARIPASRKWHEVRNGDFSSLFDDDCAGSGMAGCDSRFAKRLRELRGIDSSTLDRGLLDQVNRGVNAALTYKSDRAVWGVGDYWSTPAEMAAMGAGDCEDFAIAKYWLLRSMGVADENMQMVVLQDTRRQLFHAVLVVHTASGSYVLDNVTNRLQLDSAYRQYQPIMSFAGDRNYIHGFSGGRTMAAMPSDLSAVAPGSEM